MGLWGSAKGAKLLLQPMSLYLINYSLRLEISVEYLVSVNCSVYIYIVAHWNTIRHTTCISYALGTIDVLRFRRYGRVYR
jgi:hypothetical protein